MEAIKRARINHNERTASSGPICTSGGLHEGCPNKATRVFTERTGIFAINWYVCDTHYHLLAPAEATAAEETPTTTLDS